MINPVRPVNSITNADLEIADISKLIDTNRTSCSFEFGMVSDVSLPGFFGPNFLVRYYFRPLLCLLSSIESLKFIFFSRIVKNEKNIDDAMQDL